MIISANWLSAYVHHGLGIDALENLLTMCGLEVDGLEQIGSDLDGVVIGQIEHTAPHPNADRLTCCTVSLGTGNPLQIVCGAPNVAKGQRVPVATVGTTLLLPDRNDPARKTPVTLKKVKLRGEFSEGMICAEDELGLSDNHDGIMVLPGDAPVGESFARWLAEQRVSVHDHAIDVAITPNRPDAISHIGVARDVAALVASPLRLPEVAVPEPGGAAADRISIDIEAPELCHRYVGMVVTGVRIGESPAWLKQRLTAVGLRPRNNVVDITNFVMHECGQPLHAFDLAMVEGRRIRVRATRTEQAFVTLDDKERRLPEGTLMICDGAREVAIAGVMGGQNSEVTDETTDVLIESAWFEPSSIRRTAKALSLQTDASYRFERGVDPTGQAWAAARAAQLMCELAGGTLVDGMVDAHPTPYEPRSVHVRGERARAIIGVDIPVERVEGLLAAIGCTPVRLEKDGFPGQDTPVWDVTLPPYRPDMEREIDVIEEIARLHGYDNIPEPERSSIPNFTPDPDLERGLKARVRSQLASRGFREIYTNSMLPVEKAQAFLDPALPAGQLGERVVETLNPITTEMAALRPSLLPGALDAIRFNRNHGRRGVRFFELGRVHVRKQSDRSVIDGFTEIETLLLAASGVWKKQGWTGSERDVDIFDIKGHVEAIFASLRLVGVRFLPADGPFPQLARMEWDNTYMGIIGCTYASDVTGQAVCFAELDWDAVSAAALSLGTVRFERISRYPRVDRDLALVVNKQVPVGTLLADIVEAGGDLLMDASVFDVFEGGQLSEKERSVAFSLTFGAHRTLRDNDVDTAVTRILEAVATKHGAQLRA
ncbi:MAG: phenylalanine--tRNA ligase subunit beta [Bacteroidetes bacterium CG12_big_fil_rev_8_21_14_0_65_60_17]|nr:MAG: phenylalanine--tRNA ligase subunit beta [Bacteroidetes bacterium CG12_big_fil_rev_8_21_14_0_65_60_17]